MASTSTSHNQNARQNVWDDRFQCYRVDGILDPLPLSYYNPPSPPSPPPPPPPSPEAGLFEEQQQHHEPPPPPQPQPELINHFSGRRRRNLTASRILETRNFSFELFRLEDTKELVLFMNEVGTLNRTFYVLKPYIKYGKIKLNAKEFYLGQKSIAPVVEKIIYPILFNGSNLSLNERLRGKWTVELRQRIGSLKNERFYSHERVDRTFRSMNDVATFIVCNAIY